MPLPSNKEIQKDEIDKLLTLIKKHLSSSKDHFSERKNIITLLEDMFIRYDIPNVNHLVYFDKEIEKINEKDIAFNAVKILIEDCSNFEIIKIYYNYVAEKIIVKIEKLQISEILELKIDFDNSIYFEMKARPYLSRDTLVTNLFKGFCNEDSNGMDVMKFFYRQKKIQ